MEHTTSITNINTGTKRNVNQFTTNDLSFTAYLMMRGCSLLVAKKLGKTYHFTVDLGEFTEQRAKIDYINSESAKFDAAVRDLKKIMFSSADAY